MAPLNASDFTGCSDSYASSGITQQVFDSLYSALKCIHYMGANN